MSRRPTDAILIKHETSSIRDVTKGRRRPKKTLLKTIKKNLNYINLRALLYRAQ